MNICCLKGHSVQRHKLTHSSRLSVFLFIVVVIGFGSTNVTVPESVMTFMMCVVIQGNAAVDINVSIASEPVSALPGDGKIFFVR